MEQEIAQILSGPRVIGHVDEVQTLAINSAFSQMIAAREQLVRVWAACGLGEFDGAASYEIRGGDVVLMVPQVVVGD